MHITRFLRIFRGNCIHILIKKGICRIGIGYDSNPTTILDSEWIRNIFLLDKIQPSFRRDSSYVIFDECPIQYETYSIDSKYQPSITKLNLYDKPLKSCISIHNEYFV
jgi:hypothetical protein